MSERVKCNTNYSMLFFVNFNQSRFRMSCDGCVVGQNESVKEKKKKNKKKANDLSSSLCEIY